MRSVRRSSLVAMPAAQVWARAVTEEGINAELAPILRMTMPPGLRGRTVDDVEELRRGIAWIPGAHRLAASVIGALFHHRHRRLLAGA